MSIPSMIATDTLYPVDTVSLHFPQAQRDWVEEYNSCTCWSRRFAAEKKQNKK